MATDGSADSDPKYDRDFLLSPEKLNQLVEFGRPRSMGGTASTIRVTSKTAVVTGGSKGNRPRHLRAT
jgi:hypothetical protein